MIHIIIKNKNIQLFFRFLIFILILVGMHLIISGEKNGTISGLNPVFPAIDKGMIVFENRIDWTYANLVSYNYSSGNFHPFEGEQVTSTDQILMEMLWSGRKKGSYLADFHE